MNAKPIITIAREYGSNGRGIGKTLAEKLEVEFYDRKLIELAAETYGLAEDAVEQYDENHGTILDRIPLVTPPIYGYAPFISSDAIFNLQAEVIRKVAEKPCVIVGRCADYILRDFDHLVKIFVYADFDDRKTRAVREYGDAANRAADVVRKRDKNRAAYYNYYTNYTWGDVRQYDLCINSSRLTEDAAAELILRFIEAEKEPK